jgi:hypothetical protein
MILLTLAKHKITKASRLNGVEPVQEATQFIAQSTELANP